MKAACLVLLALLAMPADFRAQDKISPQERIALLRGIMAEYATVKTMLPRSKKPLPFQADGTWDKKLWEEIGEEMGPAARPGDLVQITKVNIENDRVVLEINGGLKSGRKWTDRVQVGMGNRTSPISMGGAPTAGTNLVVLFDKPLPPMQPADFKKMLAPVLDFDRRSAAEAYEESLPPEIKQAIKEKRPIEGMDRDQVTMTLGRPVRKSREVVDGLETEDWIYGQAPGRITFVTFANGKVIKVRESYAGLGAEAAAPLPTP